MLLALVVDELMSVAIIVAPAIVRRPTAARYLIGAAALLAADSLLVMGVSWLAHPLSHALSLDWNWFGKAASILFSAMLLLGLPSLRARVGLTFRQNTGSLVWSIALPGLAALLLGIFIWQQPPEPFSFETLSYQLLMPTLSEELIFRGTLPAVLDGAWPTTHRVGGISIRWSAVMSTAIFGAIHGVGWSGGLQIAVVPMLYATLVGSILMFVRLRSGSLLFAMITHSLLNLISNGLPMLR